MTTQDHDPVILIHGAWQGSWVWDRLIPILEERAGLVSIPVDLPGNQGSDVHPTDVNLDLYVEHIGGILERVGCSVSIVAHSGGGVVASAVAERFCERVNRIVYIAGMMLPSGMGYAEVVTSILETVPNAAGVSPHLVWSEDGTISSVPPHAAVAYFLHDCDPFDATLAAPRLTPQPEGGRSMIAYLTDERFGRIPRLYIEAQADRSVLLACQRRMQELVPGARILTLPTGHAPQFAAPNLLAEALIPFLTGFDDGSAPSSSLADEATELREGML